tara:strand:+ start:1317 stop:2156 length:840 start_codon:yes stop_codon:yes gene_type:complete
MKYLKALILLIGTTLFISSCDKVDDVLSTVGLSDSEIIEGLKEALKVGTDTATSKLAVTDGYLKDAAVKLLLPPEINKSLTAFKVQKISIPFLGEFTGEQIYTTGIPGLVEPMASVEGDLVLGINRAAETAAKDAGRIFLDAIVGITIEDGNNILFGGVDTAATAYLGRKTRISLFDEYEPKIDAALNSVQISGTSVVGVYEDYVTKYNGILNTSLGLTTIGEAMGVNSIVADDLSAYATDRGLSGLFKKVADEERLIRDNPLNRVTDILTSVFGELDK